jgi:hypothetical protein
MRVRKLTAAQREAQRKFSANYRAQRRQDKEWMKKESERKKVLCYKVFENIH